MAATQPAHRLLNVNAPASPSAASRLVQHAVRFARRFKAATVGLLFLIAITLGTIFAPALTAYNPTLPRLRERFQTPNAQYILGTDDLGRDIATRVLYGGRTTLAAGFSSVVVAMFIGSIIGIVALIAVAGSTTRSCA